MTHASKSTFPIVFAVALAGTSFAGCGDDTNSGPCDPDLGDLTVTFDPPATDGLVDLGDGTLDGDNLTLEICGTVSELDATVEVTVNGASRSATVSGQNWCLPDVSLAESPPAHTIEVAATLCTRTGSASLDLSVALTQPGEIAELALTSPNRQAVELSWTAPGFSGRTATGYIVKYATEALDDGNFDTVGTEVAAPTPSAPGTAEMMSISALRAGTMYYIGVVAVAEDGTRGLPAVAGPIIPDLDSSGGILPEDPDDGNVGLGYQIVRGDFNGDTFSDVAVSAPFRAIGGNDGVGTVYVYFGGADGLGDPAVADVVIEGVDEGGQFGNGMAALEWGGDGATDLAIGAPLGNGFNGGVYVFHGGADFANATSTADADVVISATGGWFTFGTLGFSLAAARFDNDSNDDLIISAPGGGGFNGGVAIVYGGSGDTAIALDDTNSSGNAKVHLIEDNDAIMDPEDLYGTWLANLGPTEGPGDDTDDIAIASFQRASLHVFRGRAQPAAPGVTYLPFDGAIDLEIQNDAGDTTNKFGSGLGSISGFRADGFRDIVIGNWQAGTNNGRIVIVEGDATGVRPVSDIGITTIVSPSVNGYGSIGTALLNNVEAGIAADIDNDGLEDLAFVGGRQPGSEVSLFVWYGHALPVGESTTLDAAHVIPAPPEFTAQVSIGLDTPIRATWAGDLNGDGLEDLAWGEFNSNSSDGVFAVLFDL